MKAFPAYAHRYRKSSDIFFEHAFEVRRYRIAVAVSTTLPTRHSRETLGSILCPMQQVQTHIDIEAPASLVWAILTDFGRYQRWNPLVRGVLGHLRTGTQIEIKLRSPRGEELTVRALLVHVREERELRWRERWALPGLFSSERRFRVEQLARGGVRFHHGEQAQGIMVPVLFKRRRLRGESGFDAMNTALKQRAERAMATSTVAAS